MRITIVLFLALLSAFSFAQSTAERENAIWAVATNRLLTQQDAWFEDGDYPACISLLKVEAEKWPSDYDVWTNLGWMEENVGDYPEALQTYVTYRDRNPQDPDRSLPEASYYFQKKDYAKTAGLLEDAIKVKCHPNNYRMLAWSYEKQKKYDDAVRVWKVYLGVAPTDPQAKRNLTRDEKKVGGQSL